MPVSSTATVTPWPVSPLLASCVAPVSCRNASEGVCGPVDSGTDCTFTDRFGVTVMPGSDARTDSSAVGIDASTPSMRWYCCRTVPPTSRTALAGLSSPDEVTMTCSVRSAAAGGADASAKPKTAVTMAAQAATSRPALLRVLDTPFPTVTEPDWRIWHPSRLGAYDA